MREAFENIKDESVLKTISHIKENWDFCVRYGTQDDEIFLGLPYPYVVPSSEGIFQRTLFYWDTFFTNRGLILSGKLDLALSNVNNLLSYIDRFGYVPNINTKDGALRTQPPLLHMMVKDIYHITGDKKWLANAYEKLIIEYDFWQKNRMTPIGLNRYYHSSTEEYLNDFSYMIMERLNINIENDEERMRFSVHHLAEAESGWDFNPRFRSRCADFAPVDLNCILYHFEKTMQKFSRILNLGTEGNWENQAKIRKELINQYCWNETKKVFLDYDFVNKEQSDVISVASFMPLWCKMATSAQAEGTVSNLNKLEMDYGVVVCQKTEGGRFSYQWDYPNGWPPTTYFIVYALAEYGFEADAGRIAEKYISLNTEIFKKTGEMWEKNNVVTGSLDVSDEYKMPSMLGWTAGVYLDFCDTFLYQ